jgi:glutamine amidotransferase-like uncharacterized protein
MKHVLPISILSISLLILSGATDNTLQTSPKEFPIAPQKEEVILFYPGEYGNLLDIESYRQISSELGFSHRVVNHKFINDRKSFFDDAERRTFKVLIFPGGEPYRWFEQTVGEGINCRGVENVLNFIKRGGSVIAICICGPSLFSTEYHWLNPNLEESQQGKWDRSHLEAGFFKRFCGVYAFKGALRGPQETNRPYPKTRFLPIKMNPENEIVREATLPPIIYQVVVGGGSIIPDKGQSLDVVGWFPNGTAAIGVVPYGKGKIIMSNPHPNITGAMAWKWFPNGVLGVHAKRFGWTDKMIAEGLNLIRTEGDPDGPEPDWALAKAMLSYAYKEASK